MNLVAHPWKMVVGRRCGLVLGIVLHSNTSGKQETIWLSSMWQNEQQRSNSPSKTIHCFIASILLVFSSSLSPKGKKRDVSIIPKKTLVKCVGGRDLDQFEHLGPLKQKSVPSSPTNTSQEFNSSPLKSYLPNRKGSSSNHHFSGAMLTMGGVSGQFFSRSGGRAILFLPTRSWRKQQLPSFLVALGSQSHEIATSVFTKYYIWRHRNLTK